MSMNNAGRRIAPGSNLPEYPRDGRGPMLERQLETFGDECVSAVETLDRALDEIADEFAEAFEAADKREAVRARIKESSKTGREQRARKNRRG